MSAKKRTASSWRKVENVCFVFFLCMEFQYLCRAILKQQITDEFGIPCFDPANGALTTICTRASLSCDIAKDLVDSCWAIPSRPKSPSDALSELSQEEKKCKYGRVYYFDLEILFEPDKNAVLQRIFSGRGPVAGHLVLDPSSRTISLKASD